MSGTYKRRGKFAGYMHILRLIWIGDIPRNFESWLEDTRDKALEEAAMLCERKRCRIWSPKECAMQIRAIKARGQGKQ